MSNIHYTHIKWSICQSRKQNIRIEFHFWIELTNISTCESDYEPTYAEHPCKIAENRPSTIIIDGEKDVSYFERLVRKAMKKY